MNNFDIPILKNQSDFDNFHQDYAGKESLGLIPTMGNLHDGHLSLLEVSLKDNDISIMSIFVNPTQFGKNEDLGNYPRTFATDLNKVIDLANRYPEKKVFIFFPENDAVIYPEGFNDYITMPGLNNILEGVHRPTHMNGVATVVKRVFKLVRPTRAYFGLKDYQQLILIKQLVFTEKLDVEVIGLPIVRETSGLAMSSRNGYLSTEQREEALTLNRALTEVVNKISNQTSYDTIKDEIKLKLNDKRFNYLDIRDANTLAEIETIEAGQDLVVLGNFQLGTTRLLDNLVVKG